MKLIYGLAATSGAIIIGMGIWAAPAKACDTPTTVSYEFVTDETAAGDLDTVYQDNYDYELDHPEYCTIKRLVPTAYDEAYLVQCHNVPRRP